MTSLIGYNIHDRLTYGRGYSADEQARMWSHLERLQPASLLFIDNFDWAREAKRRLPNCIVVFRRYRQNDGKLFMDMTARQFFDAHRQYGEAGLVVSVMNEPTGYGAQNSPEDLERIAGFMAEVMELFGTNGMRCCGPEFGVGHPDTNRLAELDAMWLAFKRWPQHFYGAHEYGTYRGMLYTDDTHRRDVVPWRVGRFQIIADYCQRKFGFVPNMLFNEFGIDSSFYADDDTNRRGWRDAGISEVEYARQLIRAAKTIYNKPYVRGLNIFSHGNTGVSGSGDDWRTHDVSFLEAFQRELEAYSRESAPPPPPPPADDAPESGETLPFMSAEDVVQLIVVAETEAAVWKRIKERLEKKS